MMPLLCGLEEDVETELQSALAQLKDAGLDAYLAEVQQQLDAYRERMNDAE